MNNMLLTKRELEEIAEQNLARHRVGLGQIKIIYRTCLSCGHEFMSAGLRICKMCTKKNNER